MDYISRKAAIAAAFSANGIGNSEYRNVCDIAERLRLIPAADVVERKHGEWEWAIGGGIPRARCSVCQVETMFPFPAQYLNPHNFCPNCGADMRGDDE